MAVIDQIEGFILAGGESRRMGTDKSQLLLNNQKLVDLIASNLSLVTRSVTVVGNKESGSKLRLVHDVYPKWGALGGLHGALNACSAEWALIVACDLPFVTSELFRQLAELKDGYDAIVPIQPDGRLQPLCSLYRKESCLLVASELIEKGRRRPLDLLEAVKVRRVEFAEVEHLHQSRLFFVNINTPQDYDEAIRTVTVG